MSDFESMARILTRFLTETPEIPLPTAREIQHVKESLSSLLEILLSSSELRALLADSINLVRDLFADSTDSLAQVAIKTTKVSKKLSNKLRPGQEEREGKKTGLEGFRVDEIDSKDLKKKAIRKAEDVRDDAMKALERKRQEVSDSELVWFLKLRY